LSISSIESATPPVYQLTPSRWLRGALLAVFGLALAVALGASGIPTLLRVTGVGLTLGVAAWVLPLHWPTRDRAVRAFQLEADGRAHLWRHDGTYEQHRLRDCQVWPALVVMALGQGRRRRSLFVPRDALGGEAHRRLRRALDAR